MWSATEHILDECPVLDEGDNLELYPDGIELGAEVRWSAEREDDLFWAWLYFGPRRCIAHATLFLPDFVYYLQ